MRQTGSFCPFTCVPSSLSPVLMPFITRATQRKEEGGGMEGEGGGEVMTAACVFTLCNAERVNCFSVL